jgi:hypothetical protein
MTTRTLIPQERRDLARNTIPHVEWRQALDTFLNTLSSPRTAQAYQRAVIEAMDAMGVDYVADITAPMLAEYRGWLVGRLDAERARPGCRLPHPSALCCRPMILTRTRFRR